MTTQELLINAKDSCYVFNNLTTDFKNQVLLNMAESLVENADKIIEANGKDIDYARDKISPVMIDRLSLNKERIIGMAEGIKAVSKLSDPCGEILSEHETDGGLKIKKVRVPIGVVAIIYESRPNVTSDAAALCFKSGNVCVLRGGKEAINTNKAVVLALQSALEKNNLPKTLINLVEDTSRDSANELMNALGLVDLLIPRGGAGLINACINNAKVPCIQTGTGICHIYIDEFADIDMALNIVENAKTSRPSVCNAAEVCVVNKKIANEFLPKLKTRLVNDRTENPVELRLDEFSSKIIEGKIAAEQDFDTEFLDYILAIKCVENVEEAIKHINTHSTMHSEAIVTKSAENAQKFVNSVDSSSVYINASTRFTDGGEFGLGCEMGISTQKIHARGPMGLKEMTSYKYIISGDGHIR
ncbi:MAG: glutamate-5-semialdehyde dehydrogenase [Clostridia bacterium]|nr:glutamate-5-semialdehyde dehydrogenase [Clostridia bacterium]